MKFLNALLTLSVLALPAGAFAQTATISTTDASVSGFSTGSGMQNAATSMFFANDGETLLVIKGGTTTVTATVKTQAATMSQAGYGSVALADQTISVPSGTTVVAGPFPQARWNTPIYGTVAVSMSGITGVSASALRVPQ